MKEKVLEGFGDRLTTLRKARGLTQAELGEQVGLSQRMVAYYESQAGQPPGPILPTSPAPSPSPPTSCSPVFDSTVL